MESTLKYAMICILLVRFNYYALAYSPQSNTDIYLEAVLNEIQEDWLQIFIKEMLFVCPENTYMCHERILQGNVTTESTYSLDTSFCCLAFTCFDSCVTLNDCSLYMKTRDVSETRKYVKYISCLDTFKYGESTAEYYKRKKTNQLFGHLLVSSCPEDATPEEKFLCADIAEDELRPLLDTVPVSSVSNNVNFANRFCAACHDVTSDEMSLWDVKISCSEDVEALTVENLKSVIKQRTDCFLYYAPTMSVSKSTSNMCELQIVRSCNETGSWNNYNRPVEELCLDPFLEQVHIEKVGSRKKIRYKNVFCAICNGVSKIGSLDCIIIQHPPIGPVDFSMLLTFPKDALVKTFTETTCPLGYLFIPATNDCMKTHCSSPMKTDILHNTCLQPLPSKNDDDVRLDLAFKVAMDSIITLSSRDEIETEITESLSMFDYIQCTVMFAYELETRNFQSPCNEFEDLDEHFGVVYVYIKTRLIGTDHQQVLDSRNQLPPGKNISINGSAVAIQFSQYDTDPGFILSEGSQQHGFQYLEIPYSKSAVVKVPAMCPYLDEPARVYRVTFMDCPSVLIPLQLLDIERNNFGLKIGRTDRSVHFSEFKSLNSTHVYICQKAFIDNGGSSAENANYDLSLLNFSMLFYITTAAGCQ